MLQALKTTWLWPKSHIYYSFAQYLEQRDTYHRPPLVLSHKNYSEYMIITIPPKIYQVIACKPTPLLLKVLKYKYESIACRCSRDYSVCKLRKTCTPISLRTLYKIIILLGLTLHKVYRT